MFYLGNVLLRYVLIYNLEVSFLIFQLSHNLSTIKWLIKNCFFPYSRYFLRTADPGADPGFFWGGGAVSVVLENRRSS